MARAKAAKINVSAVSEAALAAALAQRQRAALLEGLATESALCARMAAQHGSFAEAVWEWLEENPEDA